MLFILMSMHFLVDMHCGACVLGPLMGQVATADAALLLTVYNSLAFCTQFITGWLCDRIRDDGAMLLLSIVLLASGGHLISYPWFAVILLGLGNSLFHVSGGSAVIANAFGKRPWRAWSLGAFVAPGALGVTLGCLLPWLCHYTCPLFIVIAIALLGCLVISPRHWAAYRNAIAYMRALRATVNDNQFPMSWSDLTCVFCIVFCVFCRAAAGNAGGFPWRSQLHWALLLGVVMMTGKFCGGYVADCIGWEVTGLLALAVSFILLFCFGQTLAGALTGQLVANLMMAVTLFLLAVLRPNRPGFMFGLAASVLYPGSLFAKYATPCLQWMLMAIALGLFSLAVFLRHHTSSKV